MVKRTKGKTIVQAFTYFLVVVHIYIIIIMRQLEYLLSVYVGIQPGESVN